MVYYQKRIIIHGILSEEDYHWSWKVLDIAILVNWNIMITLLNGQVDSGRC